MTGKPPFRVLFSNDFYNTLTCTSPYHHKGEAFRPEMLEATVDETAGTGVEVHMLQPGVGWVPYWQSQVYPYDEHVRWLKDTYGIEPDSFDQYLLQGGDIVEFFINRCRARGLVPFISFRLNDPHCKEGVDLTPPDHVAAPPPNPISSYCLQYPEFRALQTSSVSPFYKGHPEYRLGPDINDWNQRAHNWAIPQVREHKFAFIQELCENYDLEGFELDFLRWFSFFPATQTTTEQRRAIMTKFVSRVRQLLDRTARPDQHRWLCVRVPCYLAMHDPLGIDLPAFADAGVEMANLSYSYYTQQHTDLARIAEMVPDMALYLEMTLTTSTGPVLGPAPDDFALRRTTDEQFYTTAHLAYSRGAQGMSTFNFVYYREHGSPNRGPFHEPPFHIFGHLGHPDWLAQQPQHYLVGVAHEFPVPEWPLPREVIPGQPATFHLDMAPPRGGWKTEGRLRLQAEEPLGDATFTARWNDVELPPTDNVSEPYPNPYPHLLGTPHQHRAWTVPVQLLKDGPNQVEITMAEGQRAKLIFLDVGVC